MSTLKEKAEFLKGLAEGLDLDASKKDNKLVARMLELIDEMSERIDDLEDYIDELDAKVDEIDQDLGELEEFVYDDDDDDEDFEDFDDDDVYEFTCDNCGDAVYVDGEYLDDNEQIVCPSCGEEIKIDLECDGDCDCCED